MAQFVKLQNKDLQAIRNVDSYLMSYNVEMTEVTGGTFWKAYTKEQIAGKEPFPPVRSMADFASIMQVYPPIDLYNEKLRKLAKEFGPVWVRVSGTWATKTYYDFDGHTGGKAPEGYQSVLTKEQWIGVLDFCKAINAKLLVSVNNCEGLHKANEPWNPSQAELLFSVAKEHGCEIEAAEFMNEPNMLSYSGAPLGYTAEQYVRDQDLFFKWVKENYPNCKVVGPCTVFAGSSSKDVDAAALAAMMPDNCTTEQLMEGHTQPIDVFSYHYYNGISDRLAAAMPHMHWDFEKTISDEYLGIPGTTARMMAPYRDRWCPNGQMWVTESGDAGGGGNTWACTFTDVFRTLNELGEFAQVTDGIIFHNTLASSAYGFLEHGTFDVRPNYFAVLLWNRLMGQTVYNTNEEIREGAHVYCHSRKDGRDGVCYLVINNSKTEATKVELPKSCERYTLSAPYLRSEVMQLNGKDLVLGANNELPELNPVVEEAGTIELAPTTCTFLVL